jgi:hypothetical protein
VLLSKEEEKFLGDIRLRHLMTSPPAENIKKWSFPQKRLCRKVIARKRSNRSNLISYCIHEITTTPERRLVMGVMTNPNGDKFSSGGYQRK